MMDSTAGPRRARRPLGMLWAGIVLLGLAVNAQAQVTIEITGGAEGALPIAIVPFERAEGTPRPPEDVAGIIRNDLYRSGQFKPLPNEDFIASPGTFTDVKFQNWRAQGADSMVRGGDGAASGGGFHARFELAEPLVANQYVILKAGGKPHQTALARFDGERVRAIDKRSGGAWGIKPRNKEQHFALDLLLLDHIEVVTLVGKAGTGKTLVALAAGLQKALEEQRFHKLLVARPIFPLGRDLGYLPGDIEEKLNPWMQPIYDNLEFLLGFGKQERRDGRSASELFELGYIEFAIEVGVLPIGNNVE
jgi:hypothetical protein